MASRGTQAHHGVKQVPAPQCHSGTKHCQQSHQHPPEIAQCHACVFRLNVPSRQLQNFANTSPKGCKNININIYISNKFKLVEILCRTERAPRLPMTYTRGTLSSGYMSQPPVALLCSPPGGGPGRDTPTVRFDLSRSNT